jgi:hypothetical protein
LSAGKLQFHIMRLTGCLIQVALQSRHLGAVRRLRCCKLLQGISERRFGAVDLGVGFSADSMEFRFGS